MSNICEGVDDYLSNEQSPYMHGSVGNKNGVSQEFENMDLSPS